MSYDFETGAPNAVTNDFALTVVNDYSCYQLIMGGYSAADCWKQSAYLNSLDLNQIDFPWLNRYLAGRVTETEET